MKTDRVHVVFAILFLVAVGALLRFQHLGIPIYGDEAFYFYFSKTLGLQPTVVENTGPYAPHLAARPLFYLLHFPAAQISLAAARTVNQILSCLLAPVTFLIALRVGIPLLSATGGALLVAIHYIGLKYSLHLFPDITAVLLGSLGVLAFFYQKRFWTFVFLAAACLVKEIYLVAVCALLPLCLRRGGRFGFQFSPMAPWVAASLVPVLSCIAVSMFFLGGKMQGWSSLPPSRNFWFLLLIGYAFIPMYMLLVIGRRWKELYLFCIFPLFYLGWWAILGRGVTGWYTLVGIPFCGLAVAGALMPIEQSLRRLSRKKQWLAISGGIVALFCIVIVYQGKVNRLVEYYSFRGQGLDYLREYQGLEETVQDVARLHPKRLALIDCFWTFGYYPFGDHAQSIVTVFSGGKQLTPEISKQIRTVDVAVLGPRSSEDLRAQFRPCSVSERENYMVMESPGSCQ
ncbi:MAG: hypothetical protein L3J03_03985 [Desulfobacterales bacterium]|nr:hypothetical protein [Desulfobacterales bacterium]